jgi:Icc-related predicted phosphoesterase
MKFLLLGDLHGSPPEIRIKDFDAIIATGDFCPFDKIREYMFRAIRERMKNPKTKNKWYDIAGEKKSKILIEKYLKVGRKVLKHLDSIGVPVYIVPGNTDFTSEEGGWKFLEKNHYEKMIKGLKNVLDVHQKLVDIGDYHIIGYGISSGPEKPQYKEDLKTIDKKRLKKMEAEYKANSIILSFLFGKSSKPVIFLSHNVPFKTSIDEITDKRSPRCGYHYGSLITREMIEKFKPLVCISGHMHEHFGKCRIGKTVCINAGFGPKVNVLMDLEGNKIRELEFYRWK